MKMILRKSILGLLLCCLNFYAFGAKETRVGILKSTSINQSGLDIRDQYYDYMRTHVAGTTNGWDKLFCIKGSKVTISAEIDYDGEYHGNVWWVRIPFTVKLINEFGTIVGTETGTLEVRSDENNRLTDLKDYAVYEPHNNGSTKFLRTIVDIGTVTRSTNLSSVPSNVILKAELEVDRHFLIKSNIPAVTVTNFSNFGGSGVNYGFSYTWPQDFVIFNWSYVEGAEYYELEYLFVDLGSKDQTDAFDYDFSNASRVRISKNRYKLALTFPKGWMLYRVRGIEEDCSGGHTYGNWSAYSSGTGTAVTRSADFSAIPSGTGQEQIFGWPGLETSFNWIYEGQIAEDSKRNAALSFYDGTNKNRHSVTAPSSAGKVIVSQTLYDYQGRPAVQVLPTPISNSNLRYYGPLNYYSSGVPFDRKHFDLDLGYPAMNTQYGSGAANYYSSNNPNAQDELLNYLPDAQGYPYSQVRFINDGSDRVKSRSGLGPDHHINSTHETRILYGSPSSQKELDRLFGNNVGYAKYYTKEIVTDPNGVGSVSYKDMSGRLIATAIAGGTNANMSDVDNAPAAETINADLLDNTLTLERELLTKKKFLVPSPRTDNFTYTFPALNYDPSGSSEACLSGFPSKPVKFDLSIQVYDEDGLPISLGSTFPNGVELSNLTVGQHSGASITFPGNFAPGTYTVVKKLSVNETTAESYRNQVVTHIINNAVSCGLVDPMPTADCSCDALCAQSVVKDPNAPDPTKTWNIAGTDKYFATFQDGVNDCIDLCNNPLEEQGPRDECDLLREVMLADVSPDGQYFDNIVDRFYRGDDGTLVERDPSDPSYYQDAWLENLQDAQGNPVSISSLSFVDNDGNPVSGIALENIRDRWEDSFAETLLPYHPEYCALEYYCNKIRCADPPLDRDLDNKDYASIMMSQNVYNPLNMTQNTSYADPVDYQPHASVSGSSLHNSNPEFDHAILMDCAGGNSFESAMVSHLTDYIDIGSGNYHSIWYFLDDPEGIATGGGTGIPQDIRNLYIKFHGDGSTVTGLFNDGSIDKYTLFMSAYLFFRDLEFYKQFKTNCTDLPFRVDDDVPGLTGELFGDDFDKFKIRFPRKELMEEYINNGLPGVESMANDIVNANTSTDQSPYDKDCVCGQVNTFLIQNGHISAGQTIANLTVDATLATTLSSRFGLTITVADINAWKDECNETTNVGIRSLIENNEFPAAFLCAAIGGVECSCNKLLSLINEHLTNPVASLDLVHVDAALQTFLRTELNDNTITIAQIEAWISECTHETPHLARLAGLIYTDNLSPDLLCFEEASKSCTCDRLRSYAIDENLLSSDAPLSEVDKSGLEAALHLLGYTGVQITDITQWVDACEENNTLMLNELLIYYRLPAYFLCLSPDTDIEVLADDPCAAIQQQNTQKWQEEVARLADELADTYLADYYQYALDNVSETFTDRYDINEYHYTLFYYDQAGNLVSTVPPSGVNILTEADQNAADAYRKSQTGSFVQNSHSLKSHYEYNSLNQMIWRETPDGGEEFFWYDKLGRVVLTQNAKQDPSDLYSYTVYDDLGRISEHGQIDKSAYVFTGAEYDELYDKCQDPAALSTFLSTGNRTDITFAFYDESISTLVDNNLSPDAKFLKNRTTSSLKIPGPITGIPYGTNPLASTLTYYLDHYSNAMHYGYDVHGNLRTLLREIVELKRAGSRFFRFDYEYDLLTGNVTKLSYQKDKWDQFYRRYFYDINNKLAEVETSLDNHVWSKDAKYFYYPTHKLSRKEIGGEQKIQGLDHAYNVHDWLKGINSDVIDHSRDIGKDGNTALSANNNKRFAHDVFGFSLHYYSNDGLTSKDYKPIGGTDFTLGLNQPNYTNLGKPLYNGNVSRMVTALENNVEEEIEVNGMAYYYDQLNRIKRSRSFLGQPEQLRADGDFSSTSPSAKYKTLYSYDFNGNITSLDRHDETGALMDDLSYTYDNQTAGSETNQLLQVTDAAGFLDKNDLTTQSANNYDYDEIGNLIKDDVENIVSIDWTLKGKIREIQFSGNESDLEYHYDPMGNRIMKIIKTKTGGVINNANLWEYYHYLNDAGGRNLAVYKETFTSGTCLTSNLSLEDQPIYGSLRLGTQSRPNTSSQFNFTASYDANGYFSNIGTSPGGSCSNFFLGVSGLYGTHLAQLILGNKSYQLTNHLGNVLSVVSDRKYWSPVDVVETFLLEDYNGDDPRTWENVNSGQHEVFHEFLLLTINEREDGIRRSFEGLNEECTYEICLDLTDYEGQKPPLIIRFDGKDEYTLEYGTTNCFDVSGIITLDIEIIGTGEPGQAQIDNFTITSTCPGHELIADVLSASDYYPFGSLMPNRHFNSGDYRYGFNGMEKDDEHKGPGNSYNFGARIHDPRIGRFLSVDPMAASFPGMSPYAFAANTPIAARDQDGKFAQMVIKYGIDVGINIATQMLMAYMFDDDVNSVSDAWDEVSLWQAFGEGVVDQLGTKKLRMAANATVQIFSYIDQVGIENATFPGIIAAGGIGLLEPIIGDALAKYGPRAVAKGLSSLNLSQRHLNQLLGGVFLSRSQYRRLMRDAARGGGQRNVMELKQIMAAINDGAFGIEGKTILNPLEERGADFVVDGLEIDVKRLSRDFLATDKEGLKRVAKIVNKTANNGQFVVFDTAGMSEEVITQVKNRLSDAGADMSKIDFVDSSTVGDIQLY